MIKLIASMALFAAAIAAGPSTAGVVIVHAGGGYHGAGGAHAVGGRFFYFGFIPGQGVAGAPAFVNLALTDRPEGDSGALAPDAVVGVRVAHAEDAVILADAVDENGVQISRGTVMVRMSVQGSQTLIWCSVRQMPALHPAITDCLADNHGAGRMDEYWRGYLYSKAAPFSILSLERVRPITSVAYRLARPEETPTVEIGYRFCSSPKDGGDAPYRFTSTLRTNTGGWVMSPGVCPFGEWIDAHDRTMERLDGLRLQIEPGAPARYHLLDTLGPGALAAVNPDRSIHARTIVSPLMPQTYASAVQPASSESPAPPMASPSVSMLWAPAGAGRVIRIVVRQDGEVEELREAAR